LTELRVIRHEPDNRFWNARLQAGADFIITVNTARGGFDQKMYQSLGVVTPGQFLKRPIVAPLLKKRGEG